jgi:hypothetical protein
MPDRDPLASPNDYAHLSLRDLLDARDAYHLHLMRRPNVVATAVGRYLIRKKDKWPDASRPDVPISRRRRRREPRTLASSEVRPYSWPAILVFVSKWIDAGSFSADGRFEPEDMVPPALDLPDGRKVPVCVVEAPRVDRSAAMAPPVRYPLNNIGGGSPVLADVQGREYVATVGCLVTDGHRYFGLTNRHVTGGAGEVIFSRLDGKRLPIGHSSEKQLTRLPFDRVYPGWPGRNTYVNLDIGLLDIEDINQWTAQVQNIGTVGPLVDLSSDNMSLALVGAPVRGAGAAGGLMLGEVHALFYRYKARAGFEYVADFFIGPRTARNGRAARSDRRASSTPLATFPGDSGTLWLLDPPKPLEGKKRADPPPSRPLALQWGENAFETDAGAAQPYVLATCLSTVCNELGVDPVRDWNLDQPDTWGAVGHFSIAARTEGALSSRVPRLKELMSNNLLIISHDDATILTSDFKGMGSSAFVPMADVPDFFWKHGQQGASRAMEGPNHFADMDQKRHSDGQDLLALTRKDEEIDPGVWDAFYDSVQDLLTGEDITQQHRGLLPFRVWQIFDEMVKFASTGKAKEFVCAAGVLAHYVGDACQPLHISYLHDGDPEQAVTRTVHHRNGTDEDVKEPLGKGVHSAYEDDMVNANREKILAALAATPKVLKAELLSNGFEAAKATIELMRATFKRIPPLDIVQAFIGFKGAKKDRTAAFWKQFGTDTLKCMQDGTHLVATLWESAWAQGGGETAVKTTAALTQKEAMAVVRSRNFLPSLSVAEIGVKLHRPS